MRRTWGICAVPWFVAAGCLGPPAGRGLQEEDETAQLSVSPASLNFGDIIEGETSATAAIIISAAEPTGALQVTGDDGASIVEDDCSNASLDEGAYCQVLVRLAANDAGPLESRLQVTDGNLSGESTLRGNGVVADGSLVVSPASLSFPPGLTTDVEATQTFILTNQGSGTIGAMESSLTVSQGSPHAFSTELNTCDSLGAGESCTIDVRFAPAEVGVYLGSLRVGHRGGEALASISAEALQPTRTLSIQHTGAGTKDMAVALCDGECTKSVWPIEQCGVRCLVSPNESDCPSWCSNVADFRCRASANFYNDDCAFEVPAGTELSVLGEKPQFQTFSGCDDLVDYIDNKESLLITRTCSLAMTEDSYAKAHYTDK